MKIEKQGDGNMKIEKETTYDELTAEQIEVLDGIRKMVRDLQEMIDILGEATDYNDPRLGGFVPSQPAGFRYTITVDMDRFRTLMKRVENMTGITSTTSYDKVVTY